MQQQGQKNMLDELPHLFKKMVDKSCTALYNRLELFFKPQKERS
ncbi:hypothetical protein ACFOGI_05895 [Virgibacillus xinjiangensis]|uniref:Transposase n=1 Tax=Virgibacillus xinjiangensis TaxID=393090 RepID=A0ABV7CTV8_9BACI